MFSEVGLYHFEEYNIEEENRAEWYSHFERINNLDVFDNRLFRELTMTFYSCLNRQRVMNRIEQFERVYANLLCVLLVLLFRFFFSHSRTKLDKHDSGVGLFVHRMMQHSFIFRMCIVHCGLSLNGGMQKIQYIVKV